MRIMSQDTDPYVVPRPRTPRKGRAVHPLRLGAPRSSNAGKLLVLPAHLLYSEPPRLAAMGLLTETRETPKADDGASSRSRVPVSRPSKGGSTNHPARRRATRSRAPAALLRRPGLRGRHALRLAEQQLAIHRAKLAAYKEDERFEDGSGATEGRADGRTLARRDVEDGPAVRGRGGRVLGGDHDARSLGRSKR